MLNTFADIKNEVLVRLSASTTLGFYTDAILNSWFNDAYSWAASFKKWPFTERRDNTATWSSGTEDYAYPSDFRSDGIRLLQVGTRRLQKLTFEDYQIFREEEDSADDRVWADFGRRFYINPNVDSSGTITVWGQYTPVPVDVTDTTVTTVFSDAEEEGNEAIVEKILEFAKTKEKKMQESLVHRQKAVDILDAIWKRIGDEQFLAHTKNRGMFKRINILSGATEDELLKRDQWY